MNPSLSSGSFSLSGTAIVGALSYGRAVFLVDFDVAVSAGSSSEGSGSAKLSVASLFEAKAGAGVSTTSESVSRIRFKVPIVLLVDDATLTAAVSELEERERKANRPLKVRSNRIV